MSKFKVGDRVRLLSKPYSESVIGSIGTVRKIDPHDTYIPIKVSFPGGGRYNPRGYRECELQYAPDQTFKLERGDRIVNNKTGRKGHVVIGQDNRLWVVDHTYCEEAGAPAAAVEEYEEHYPGTYEWTEGPF